MFTIKFYSDDGFRQRILEAESFTVLRDQMGNSEITLHRATGPNGELNDVRYDINTDEPPGEAWPDRYIRAVIENAMGKTSEVIVASLGPRLTQNRPLGA